MSFSSDETSSDEEGILYNSSLSKWYMLKEKHKEHTHELNRKRHSYGEFHHLYEDLRKDPQRFFEYMRMSSTIFDYIKNRIEGSINKSWHSFHSQPISVEERLMLTIRYLSTGISFRSLAFSFRMGKSTVSQIVSEIADYLWDNLYETHMPVPTQNDFKKVANDFNEIWNFPNCVGALDGKHVRIRCPNNSGSMFFNYKGYFSIVLQALVDANYKFINIDVGGYGKQSDGGTFKASQLYKKLIDGTLNLPNDSTLPGSDLVAPFVIIADEAYPLYKHLLKPYSRQDLNPEREMFNKRLSRARRTVECAFGILRAKWQILDKPILTTVTNVDKIVKAICVLHNTIIGKEGVDHNLRTINIVPENRIRTIPAGRLNSEGKNIREIFRTYFCNNPIV